MDRQRRRTGYLLAISGPQRTGLLAASERVLLATCVRFGEPLEWFFLYRRRGLPPIDWRRAAALVTVRAVASARSGPAIFQPPVSHGPDPCVTFSNGLQDCDE